MILGVVCVFLVQAKVGGGPFGSFVELARKTVVDGFSSLDGGKSGVCACEC